MARNILITGGAGFIGSNTAEFYLRKEDHVYILDNFLRKGSKANSTYLLSNYKKKLHIITADIRYDQVLLNKIVSKMDIVFHFAGQVAVTASLRDPRADFETNALGTFNILEAVRQSGNNPIFIYSSTNKVYGDLANVKISEQERRYSFENIQGISELFPVDFYSPYGCSKGAADQYVRDYYRMYGLRTIVFRQSCIYGSHQFGIEDQGWLAWFLIRILQKKSITIYGDGKQVRDILHIDDLVRAYDLAIENIDSTKGKIYNVGGGIKNSVSIWLELQEKLESITKKHITVNFADWRPGDQKIYVSDIRKSKKEFLWEPKIDMDEGISSLYIWLQNNVNLL